MKLFLEQLCCIDTNGKSSVSSRKLNTMYVCDFCSGLFADGDALDKHRLTCFIEDDNNIFENKNVSITFNELFTMVLNLIKLNKYLFLGLLQYKQ